MDSQITRIIEKLKMLNEADSKRTVFGAQKHQYKLNARLPEEELHQFEARHNIKLPQDFIAFYTMIGNGGAGPFYGVEPLENVLFSDLDYKKKDSLLNPSLPFTHIQAWNMVFVATVKEEENKDLYEKQIETFYNEYYDNTRMNGTLALCNYGCGISLNLVVNGPEHGYIWTDDRGNEGGIYPSAELGNEQKIRFLDWYELWLDHSIAEVRDKNNNLTGKAAPTIEQPVKNAKPWWKCW